MDSIETDYLVIGAGATAMAFTDSLIAEADADVVMVDRRHSPGGHWNDDYPFVRLHQPSALYGVVSRPLGNDRIDDAGPNAGWRRVVDATHTESSLPSTHMPSFGVDPDAQLVTPNQLVGLSEPASGLTALGSGKTAMDTCCWLVDNGRPRCDPLDPPS